MMHSFSKCEPEDSVYYRTMPIVFASKRDPKKSVSLSEQPLFDCYTLYYSKEDSHSKRFTVHLELENSKD